MLINMRVLVVAPDQPGINSVPEVRLIQSWHHTSTLNGRVTPEDIFRACQDTAFDVIHYATHGGPDGVALSDNIIFDAEDIAQVARIKETPGIIFNSCETGVLANYAVRHGVRWAISADGRPEDLEAWKLPCALYGAMRNGHAKDFVGAFILADSGDGMFGLRINPTWLQDLQHAAALVATLPTSARPPSRQEVLVWGGLVVVAAGVLASIINLLAGSFY